MSSHTSKKLRLLLFSVIIIILILEVIIRFGIINIYSDYCNADYWWKNKWYNQKWDGVGTADQAYITRFGFHPELGWIVRPGLEDYTPQDNFKLNSNSKGIRGKEEHSYQKNDKTSRIITIGDSFTFGDEVDDDKTFPAQLELMMKNTEVINLGVFGYGHDQQLIYLQKEGVKYNPDLVILGFYGENKRRNSLEFRDYPKPRFVLSDGKLELENSPVKKFRPGFRLFFTDIFSKFSCVYGEKTGKRIQETEDVSLVLLDKIIEETRLSGAEFLMFYVPDVMEVESGKAKPHHDFFMNFCSERKIHCVDARKNLRDDFTALNSQLYLGGGHFSERGNMIVASVLNDYISKNSLIES